MPASNITGGETVTRTVQLSDADMEAIKYLRDRGLGNGNVDSESAHGALVGLRRRSGLTRGQQYERMADAVRAMRDSCDPRTAAAWKKANAPLAREKLLATGNVHTDATIAQLSVQYANDAYIGEQFMPAIEVPKESGVFYSYNERDRFAYPEDEIGESSEAHEISDSRTTGTYACKGYAYQNWIGASTVANQDAPLNELVDLSEAIFEGLAFRREMREATVVTTAANYPTGNKATIAAANRWDSAGGGNPIKDIQDADAALWMGRGPTRKLAGSSLAVYQVLSRHPDILGLFQYNGSSPGLATPTMIARFFEADDYLVGRARKDTANEGAAASYSRIWGDFFWLTRVMTRPGIRNAAFGLTFRWAMPGVPGATRGMVTQQWFDQKRGLGGAYYAKAGVSEDHKIIADKTGYLITTPIG